jgi:tRNA(Arg) A34 adenosine deaminase TadA
MKKKVNLLVIRLTMNGKLSDSHPCCMCVNMLKMYGVKRVYYSTPDGGLCCQKVKSLDDSHVSHGLRLMLSRDQYSSKLPLTRDQKRLILETNENYGRISSFANGNE